MATLTSQNPYTFEINASIETISRQELDTKITLAHETFLTWKQTSFLERRQLFLNLARLIEAQKSSLALTETQEMWMLHSASVRWLENGAKNITWFALHAQEFISEEHFEENGVIAKMIYDPLGVIFWIAPWNFPFNQVLRAAVPNIIAGNTVVYKHASNCPLSALKLEELFLEAGFPQGVYQNIFVSSSESEYILSKKEIVGVNITWGVTAGKNIASLAGSYLKRAILELWGNDAFIVCDTANIDHVARQALLARIANAWQKCNASKRFIVPEKYYDEFLTSLTKHTQALKVGDPMDPNTELWPLAKKELVEEIDSQVKKTIWEGARLLTWGYIPDRQWYFYTPTILADVTPKMTSFQQEIFGPVASVIRVKDLDEAVKIANQSDFWLCACVYGDNQTQIQEVASKIETWMVFLNTPAGSKAQLPYGGVKNSGYGKENGPEGLRAFTNKKVIVG